MKPGVRGMAMKIAVALALLGLVPAAAVWAQKKNQDSSTRSVQGTVANASGAAVAGAVVQLKNTKSLQIRSFITKDQGEYYFNSLSPDTDYELRAMFSGASSPTKTLSAFDGRKQAIFNLKLDK
jgi:hypothetical protein